MLQNFGAQHNRPLVLYTGRIQFVLSCDNKLFQQIFDTHKPQSTKTTKTVNILKIEL